MREYTQGSFYLSHTQPGWFIMFPDYRINIHIDGSEDDARAAAMNFLTGAKYDRVNIKPGNFTHLFIVEAWRDYQFELEGAL